VHVSFSSPAVCIDLDGQTFTGTITDTGFSWLVVASQVIGGITYRFSISCGYSGGGVSVLIQCNGLNMGGVVGINTLTCSPLDATGNFVVNSHSCGAGCPLTSNIAWHLTL
jgi:hypothetical protein